MSDFFTPVGNTKPYFKTALEGFAGSGKTYTACQLAIGLHKKIKSKKPVVFFDTERASKFMKKYFDEAGIELMIKESRTLADLKETMRILREESYSDVLIIDSISHIWENTLEAYKTKKKRSFIQFQDWGVLKPLWKEEFSQKLVDDPYHIIMCGRAGYEYENEINEDTGRREIYKSGVKMKVEGETAYEPDLLVFMERFEEILDKDNKKVYRQATVIKDRSNLLDGKTFQNPTFEDFEPAMNDILSNPQKAQRKETDSTGLFKTEEEKLQYLKDRDIVLEEIQGEMLKAWPSTSAREKKAKVALLEEVFGTTSWKKVESMKLTELKSGLEETVKIVKKELESQFPDKKGGK